MGGSGSGNRWRFGTRATCEGMKRIEMSYLKRKGLLVPGRSGSLSWTLRGEPNGDIRYSVHVTMLELNYRYRNHGEHDWTDVRELVRFDSTHQHLGGRRRWFLCPACNKRCSILYGGARFCCRQCHNLAYSTQNESLLYRSLTKAQKIRERLGGSVSVDDPFPAKPKGMHQRTYRRIKAKGYLAERRVNQLSAVFLEHLKGLI